MYSTQLKEKKTCKQTKVIDRKIEANKNIKYHYNYLTGVKTSLFVE
jgi:hypothetical protein